MSGFAHFVHFIITILFFPWVIIWIICAVSASNKHKKSMKDLQIENNQLLRKLADKEK